LPEVPQDFTPLARRYSPRTGKSVGFGILLIFTYRTRILTLSGVNEKAAAGPILAESLQATQEVAD